MNISQESIGTVERIIESGGFGFISVIADHSSDAPAPQGDVFFHRSSLENLDFDAGLVRRRVRFKLSQGHKGWNATDITAAD